MDYLWLVNTRILSKKLITRGWLQSKIEGCAGENITMYDSDVPILIILQDLFIKSIASTS